MDRFLSRQHRKYLYTVAVASMAVLVAYDVISGEQAPVWLALIAAITGITAPATALANLTPKPSDIADNAELEIEGE